MTRYSEQSEEYDAGGKPILVSFGELFSKKEKVAGNLQLPVI